MKKLHKFLFALGRPLSPVYSWLMYLRALFYRVGIFKSHSLPVSVISVGNLTMGGTGKTPVVMYIAKLLISTERKPAVISRGYGGKSKKRINVVSDGKRIRMAVDQSGDEPRLIADALPRVPVLTGPKRAILGESAITQYYADTIIMDDGLQHMSLRRDLNFVLFSARTFLGNGRVFPGGEMREPLTALKRAHGFVITGVDGKNSKGVDEFKMFLENKFPKRPVFLGKYIPTCLVSLKNTEIITLEKGKTIKFFGFCGIADPDSFINTLVREGFNMVGFRSYRDHHAYSMSDLEELIGNAAQNEARALITTEKDMVKLRRLKVNFPVYALRIELEMEEFFDRFILSHLRKNRH